MSRSTHLFIAIAFLLATPAHAGEPSASLFPFTLPWDDAASGPTDLSGWRHKPAGKLGAIHAGRDGHLYAGTERIRFFGVNLCFDANFPEKPQAEKIAARMAKFGINVVRFHHMDMFSYPAGIRARNARSTGDLDAEALDRLDNFISRLKAHGIYANLNLLVSRPFAAADGLPAEIDRVDDWKARHVAGFFHEPLLKLQQVYARKLLAHRNPYTSLTYAEDPAVAFVEINNENGLIQGWMSNQVDPLPEVFLGDLRKRWNARLKQQYGTTARLRQAWGIKDERPGAELLANGSFARGVDGWLLEQHDQAQAAVEAASDIPAELQRTPAKSVRIAVTRPSSMGWHVQFNQSGLKVKSEQPYTLAFWAKADRPRAISAVLSQAHEPWQPLGASADSSAVKLTSEWTPFRYVFKADASDDNARILFGNLATETGTVWLAGVSLRPGGTAGLTMSERVEDGSIKLVARSRFGEYPAPAQRDWLRCLWEQEDSYWRSMRDFLKHDLGVRGVVVGTIVGCSTPTLMARFDAIDTHAYWQHPHFPHRAWDPSDWVVANRTMVNEVGGTLPGLALRRVQGKPHIVSEYNHSAPNTYGSEGFLLLAAYGALQDWDALYAFAYSHRKDWDAGHITSFFDIDQHPTKMVTLPAAVAMFVRGDVSAARDLVTGALDKESEIDALRKTGAWELVHGGHAGVPAEAALVRRIAIAPKPSARKLERPSGPEYASDTGQLLWDLSHPGRGVVTVNSPKSKAVIGYASGQRFDLGGIVIEPGPTVQDGWCAITVTAMTGEIGAGHSRLLVTATGTAENTDMRWTSPAHESVAGNWGRRPARVEGIPARLTLPSDAGRTRVWSLDVRGQRSKALPVENSGDARARFTIGPERQTLWYDVEVN
jgi:hypothetical protein